MKDWRLAVCTRYRPLVTFSLIIGLFLCLFGFGWVRNKLGYNPEEEIFGKKKSLKIGMTEQDLIKIMGKPQLTKTMNTSEIMETSFDLKESFDEFKKNHPALVEYTFCGKRRFGSTAVRFVSGIYLDENHEKILLISPWGGGWYDQISAGSREGFLLFITLIALPWIGLRQLCRRRQKKLDTQHVLTTPSKAK